MLNITRITVEELASADVEELLSKAMQEDKLHSLGLTQLRRMIKKSLREEEETYFKKKKAEFFFLDKYPTNRNRFIISFADVKNRFSDH